MSDPNTARLDARPATHAEAFHGSRWRRRALLVATLAVFSALANAQNVNPDETGHEPVSTRTALQNAASIASLMLTTEAMIADIPETKSTPAPSGHGGMDY